MTSASATARAPTAPRKPSKDAGPTKPPAGGVSKRAVAARPPPSPLTFLLLLLPALLFALLSAHLLYHSPPHPLAPCPLTASICPWYLPRPTLASGHPSTALYDAPRARVRSDPRRRRADPPLLVAPRAVQPADVAALLATAPQSGGEKVLSAGLSQEKADAAVRAANVALDVVGIPDPYHAETWRVRAMKAGETAHVQSDWLDEAALRDRDGAWESCQRAATALLFLTGGGDAGRVVFPGAAEEAVEAEAGTVVVWYNVHPMTERVDERALYTVEAGEGGIVVAMLGVRNCSREDNRVRKAMGERFREWQPRVSLSAEDIDRIRKEEEEKGTGYDFMDEEEEDEEEVETFDEEDEKTLAQLERMDESELDEEDADLLADLRERRDMALSGGDDFTLDDLDLLRELEAQESEDGRTLTQEETDILEDLREEKRKFDERVAALRASAEAAGGVVVVDGEVVGAAGKGEGHGGKGEGKGDGEGEEEVGAEEEEKEVEGDVREAEGVEEDDEEGEEEFDGGFDEDDEEGEEEVGGEGREPGEDEEFDDVEGFGDEEGYVEEDRGGAVDEFEEEEDEWDDEFEDEDGAFVDGGYEDSDEMHEFAGHEEELSMRAEMERMMAAEAGRAAGWDEDEDEDEDEMYDEMGAGGQCGGETDGVGEMLFGEEEEEGEFGDGQCGGGMDAEGDAFHMWEGEDEEDGEEFVPLHGGGKVIPPMDMHERDEL